MSNESLESLCFLDIKPTTAGITVDAILPAMLGLNPTFSVKDEVTNFSNELVRELLSPAPPSARFNMPDRLSGVN